MKTNELALQYIYVPLQFIKNTIGHCMFKISDDGIYFSIIGDRAIIIEIKMTEQYNVQPGINNHIRGNKEQDFSILDLIISDT